MESQSETTQTVSALKLSILKTGEYDLWSMRMEQYLIFVNHTFWEVIVNVDTVSPVASARASAEGPIPPKNAKQKLARKNELKAKSTLILAISDEHLLKFHACKDAKSFWEAIKNRFGGNKKSKKMEKTILKQYYKNFAASSKEGLDKTYDSLPSAWNNIALIMRNKSDLDTLSMDDLYNNLKEYKFETKSQSSSSLNSQNVTFVSLDDTSSTNETVNTAHSVSAASYKDQTSTGSYADDVMFSFFSNQSNALHLDNEDLEQIDTGRKLDLNGNETAHFDRIKVECYNCHRRGHFVRECMAPRNQGKRNRDAPTRNALVDISTTNALVVQDGIGGYDWSFQAEKELINFALMAYTSQGSSSSDFKVNKARAGMSSASSAVTYISVYTDSEPGRVFWGADEELSDGGSPRVIVYGYDRLPILPVAPPSPDYIPGLEEPQTPPAPQDEDEHKTMFIQPHDPDFVPETIYPKYIPLENEHILPVEEQPLPPVVLPTAESPGYVAESDPEEDPEEYEDDEREDGLVDYPMDRGDDGDDDDVDSSGDDSGMSSASSAVTYISVYTDSEPGRVFWGADEELSDGGSPRVIVYGYDRLPILPVAPPSPDYIPGLEEPQTPPAPQDEDEHKTMFIQPHDPDFVPETIYPKYIPLENEHILPVEEQPLPPVVLPTAESPGYVAESDPEEDPEEYEDDEREDGLVDYPMDRGDDGDDDDVDSSGDDCNTPKI
nr:ribonuclease H-like domain-containing protein [Tanacetum cinerariifolium]